MNRTQSIAMVIASAPRAAIPSGSAAWERHTRRAHVPRLHRVSLA